MKHRHAAALALIVWYFMTPPVSKNGDLLYSAPLKDWEYEKAGATLAECEKGKQEASLALMKFSSEKVKVVQAGKCIAADDPRLKGDPRFRGN